MHQDTLFPGPREPTFVEKHPAGFTISEYLQAADDAEARRARGFIDHWIQAFPPGADRDDLAQRLLARNNDGLVAAFLELATFAWLSSLGFDPQPHVRNEERSKARLPRPTRRSRVWDRMHHRIRPKR